MSIEEINIKFQQPAVDLPLNPYLHFLRLKTGASLNCINLVSSSGSRILASLPNQLTNDQLYGKLKGVDFQLFEGFMKRKINAGGLVFCSLERKI